jgi:hypothetical protein
MRDVIMTTGSRPGGLGAHVAHEVEAVHARHLDVGQHHRRPFFGQPLQRVHAVLGQ